MSEEQVLEIEKIASVLKLLGDKTRLTMVALLKDSECCVCEFVEIFEMSQPSVSQHLRKLRDLGLVKEQRKGQWVFYSLDKENVLYSLIKDLLIHVPSQKGKLVKLEESGLRISCN
ncbi:ArsR/SmtB family transcription factor [Bacillus sp. FJAT-45350]|uniref:ArsR/SmtB family transcription factor n=1 Tax=Bacillus sp. FJAT-45350 TaxID=2011014 RepID=UPI000BB77404|nr:metalloregulator ArsR/SmtB family transcription factor [Bacillus sp. FJAT-45350]